MGSKTYEMLWDCPRCGTDKLLGKSHRHCPNCGAPQDPEQRYFPDDDEKVAVEDHVYVGADLACSHCETPNSARAKHCVNCGAPMGDDDATVDLVEDPDAAPVPADPDPPAGASSFVDDAAVAGAAGGGGGCALGIAGLVALAVIGVAVMCLWKKPATFEVADRTWTREIAVEVYREVSESGWCDAAPTGAEIDARSEKKRSTKKVPDGEECHTVRRDNGDGTFTETEQCTTTYREEPVYDDWCAWREDKWVVDRWEKASGRGVEPGPRWPAVSTTGCHDLGCTREGSRRQQLRVALRGDDGDRQHCDLSEATWRSMAQGSRWRAKVRVVTGGIDCSTLRPARSTGG